MSLTVSKNLFTHEGVSEKSKQPSFNFSYLPTEIVLNIFKFLSCEDLGRAQRVCTDWRLLAGDETLWEAFDLKELFPSLKIIDKKDWETYVDLKSLGLEINDEPQIGTRTFIQDMKKIYFRTEVQENDGLTLLTLPKGLTFDKLVTLASSPKKGNATSFAYIGSFIADALGSNACNETCRIVITNNILKNSCNLSIIDQRKLVNSAGCELPKMLEVATLLILTYIKSGEYFYQGARSVFTRCSDVVEGSHLVVGGYGSYGLFVYHDFNNDDAKFGVGAVSQI
jgi:hypothetical protein